VGGDPGKEVWKRREKETKGNSVHISNIYIGRENKGGINMINCCNKCDELTRQLDSKHQYYLDIELARNSKELD
jgi:hypothetical protein